MSKPMTGLGRGLDALFPSGFVAGDVVNGKQMGVNEVALANIKAKPQPRTHFDEEKIEQLAYSIKEHGVLQPILLIEDGGTYTIVAGERRYRAAKKAGLTTIPAIVRTASELQQLEIALVENIQREDLDPIEQAMSIKHLHEHFSQDYDTIAKKLGKAKTTLINLVRLLGLPAPYQEALREGVISEGHARALLALSKDPEAQQILFVHIVEHHWSVRKAELFVQSHKKSEGSENVRKTKMQDENEATIALSQKLSRQVKIQRTAKGGKLTIAFKDDDDLERLLSTL